MYWMRFPYIQIQMRSFFLPMLMWGEEVTLSYIQVNVIFQFLLHLYRNSSKTVQLPSPAPSSSLLQNSRAHWYYWYKALQPQSPLEAGTDLEGCSCTLLTLAVSHMYSKFSELTGLPVQLLAEAAALFWLWKPGVNATITPLPYLPPGLVAGERVGMVVMVLLALGSGAKPQLWLLPDAAVIN